MGHHEERERERESEEVVRVLKREMRLDVTMGRLYLGQFGASTMALFGNVARLCLQILGRIYRNSGMNYLMSSFSR